MKKFPEGLCCVDAASEISYIKVWHRAAMVCMQEASHLEFMQCRCSGRNIVYPVVAHGQLREGGQKLHAGRPLLQLIVVTVEVCEEAACLERPRNEFRKTVSPSTQAIPRIGTGCC